MEISSSTLLAVAAERATMFVALEPSKSSWLVALYSPVAEQPASVCRWRRRRATDANRRRRRPGSAGRSGFCPAKRMGSFRRAGSRFR